MIDPRIRAFVDARRLATEPAERLAFSVARIDALRADRERAGDHPLSPFLRALRAAHALGPGGRMRVTFGSDPPRVTVSIRHPCAGRARVRGLLDAAVTRPTADAEPADRFAHHAGRFVNRVMARSVTEAWVRTPAGSLRAVLDETAPEGIRTDRTADDVPGDLLEFEATYDDGVVAALARWWRGQSDLPAAWRRLVGAHLPSAMLAPERDEHALDLPTGRAMSFGAFGWFVPSSAADGLFLLDEGVAWCEASAAVAERCEAAGRLRGFVTCPEVDMDASEGRPVRDANFELLVAWLDDVATGRFHRCAAAPPRQLVRADGRAVPADDLRAGNSRAYVFFHQRAEVPPGLRSRVLVCSPAQIRALADVGRAKGLRHLATGLASARARRPIAEALAEGSLPPLRLATLARGANVAGRPLPCQATMDAYVHDAAGVRTDAVVVALDDRPVGVRPLRLADVRGVTLLVRLAVDDPTRPVERSAVEAAVDDLAREAAERLARHLPPLLRHVVAEADDPWSLPLLRTVLEHATGADLGLGYAGRDGPRLEYDVEAPLAGAWVGTWKGEPRSLADALSAIARDGGLLVRGEGLHWPTLEEADDPPWVLHPAARRLLERLVGPEAVWVMPDLRGAHVPPGTDLAAQPPPPADDVHRWIARSERDPRARVRLVVEACRRLLRGDPLDEPLRSAAWVRTYAPQRRPPRLRRTVAELWDRRQPPSIVVPGTGERAGGPVIEASPEEAWALGRTLGFADVPRHAAGPGARGLRPRRARQRTREPLGAFSVPAPLSGIVRFRPYSDGNLSIRAAGRVFEAPRAPWSRHLDGTVSLPRLEAPTPDELARTFGRLRRLAARHGRSARRLTAPGAPDRAAWSEILARLEGTAGPPLANPPSLPLPRPMIQRAYVLARWALGPAADATIDPTTSPPRCLVAPLDGPPESFEVPPLDAAAADRRRRRVFLALVLVGIVRRLAPPSNPADRAGAQTRVLAATWALDD